MKNGTSVWIVGRLFFDPPAITRDPPDNERYHGVLPWTFQGVFLTEAEADAACRDYLYFIAPAKIGETLPHEPCEWPGARFANVVGVEIGKVIEELRERSKEIGELASVSDEELAS